MPYQPKNFWAVRFDTTAHRGGCKKLAAYLMELMRVYGDDAAIAYMEAYKKSRGDGLKHSERATIDWIWYKMSRLIRFQRQALEEADRQWREEQKQRLKEIPQILIKRQEEREAERKAQIKATQIFVRACL